MKKNIHKYTEDDILKYMDDDLSAWSRFWFSRHLRSCLLCKQMISDYRLIEQGLKAKADTAVSLDFKTKLMNKVPDVFPIEKKQTAKVVNFKWSYPAAALIILGIITLYFISLKPQELADSVKFFAMSTNPSTYIDFQHFIQKYYAILSMFRSLIAYVVVGLISAWGIFYIHKSSN